MQDSNRYEDSIYELWLIYDQLKDAEINKTARDQLISSARTRLGRVVNTLNRFRLEPKSVHSQAANLNYRPAKKLDIRHR
jgi:hypothetical protein